jgi:hypothetical protein
MKGMNMASNHTVSTILHAAADKYLASKNDEYKYNSSTSIKEKFSCCAISSVIREEMRLSSYDDRKIMLRNIYDGLQIMGCDVHSCDLFSKYNDPAIFGFINKDVQGMRYIWLKWAALMAEEQGL